MPRKRRDSRFERIHEIVHRMRFTGGFHTRQFMNELYPGGRWHPQQRQRALKVLKKYVEAGYLQHDKRRGVFWPEVVQEPTERQLDLRERLEAARERALDRYNRSRDILAGL